MSSELTVTETKVSTSPEEERVPLSLEEEMIRLEDTAKTTEDYRQELLEKMIKATRNIEITPDELKSKGSREAIAAVVKMTSDLLNDTESSQHKRIAAKARLREAVSNDKIASQGIELLKQLQMGDNSSEKDLPIDVESFEVNLTPEEEKEIKPSLLKTDPNDIVDKE